MVQGIRSPSYDRPQTTAPPHRPPLTCRSYDALAPIIHEFTYEAMVYDLLGGSMEDNVYK